MIGGMNDLPPQKIFRAYDIRGIAEGDNPDLTPTGVEAIGRATGSYYRRHDMKRIAVAHDCRTTNPELAEAFIRGLRAAGCDVTLIGMVTTPLLYFTVAHFGFDGGAMITASHNPKEYNGVKIVGKGAHSICGDELQVIYKMMVEEDFETGEGSFDEKEVFSTYLEEITKRVQLDRKLKVVVDAGNGAAGPFVLPLFEALGCEVIALYTEPDGNFPNHPANPEEEENMLDLIAAVKEHGADLGIAFDGDGDRVGVVNEKGFHYNADWLLLLLARDVLSRQPGAKIVFDVKVSQVLIDDIAAHGGEPVMQKTGHSFIETKMREIGAPLAGEISGHLFFAENYYGFDDAFLGAAKLLQIASQHEGPFSSLYDGVPETACTPEIKCATPDDRKFQIVDELTAHFTALYSCSTIDGVRINFDENSWGAVRCSNTSPNLTVRFEAPTDSRLKEIMAIMKAKLEEYPEVSLAKWTH